MRFFDDFNASVRDVLLAQIRNLWTHSSTAIEGNSLSLGDTAFILEEGLTVGGKPIKDHQEVMGHARAIDLMYGLLDKPEIEDVDLFLLHRAIIAEHVVDIFQPIGAWKNEPNYTSYLDGNGRQVWREYPSPLFTTGLMSQWLYQLACSSNVAADDVALARCYADLHLQLATIHPFFDGNGRMARLLANIPVLKAGQPPIVIPAESRQVYKKLLSDYQNTITNLAGLRDLSKLPENTERQAFRDFCLGCWQPTIELVQAAREVQSRATRGMPSP